MSTFAITTLAAFQLRSFGTLPCGARRTITAAVTLVTAPGGDPNDFSSVRFALFKVFRASWAATNAGSAFTKSASQSFCFLLTSSAIIPTLSSSSSAEIQMRKTSEHDRIKIFGKLTQSLFCLNFFGLNFNYFYQRIRCFIFLLKLNFLHR